MSSTTGQTDVSNNDAICAAKEKLATQLESKSTTSRPLSQDLLSFLEEISISHVADNQTQSENFHTDVCSGLNEIMAQYPQQFMQHFADILTYLTEAQCSKDVHVSTAACKYWAQLPVPPVPMHLMEQWTSGVMPHLSTIMSQLIHFLKYDSVLLQHVDTHSGQNSHSEEAALYSDRRNFAAMALENLCKIFQASAIDQLRPVISDWCEQGEDRETSDWCEQEAIMLTIAACVEAVGVSPHLTDLWPRIFHNTVRCCAHHEPLVRCMASFLLQHLVGEKVPGCKKAQSDILRQTLRHVTDASESVQEMALRTLALCIRHTALPHNTVAAAAERLAAVAARVSCRTRSAYCDCLSMLISRCVAVDKAMAETSIQLLLGQWQQLDWANIESQSAEDVVQLCQPMCAAIMSGKQLFKTHNKAIVDTICQALKKLVSEKSAATSTHIVAVYDVLSALFEGQGTEVSSLCTKQGVLPMTLQLLQRQTRVTEQVKQSSVALLGHMCHCDYEHIEPHLNTIVAVTSHLLTEQSPAVRNNVLWLLAQLTAQVQRKHPPLFALVKQLTNTIVFNEDNVVYVINIVVALTNLAARFADMALAVLDPHLFQSICFLLPISFPREQEKHIIASNLVSLLTEHLRAVTVHHWLVFCSAIVVPRLDDPVTRKVTRLLRDARTSMDTAAWKSVTQHMPHNVIVSLRKKFKTF